MPTPPHPTAPARRPHAALRRAALAILALLLLLVPAFAVCEILGWPFLRHPVEARLSRMLDRPVRFGDRTRVHLLGTVRASTDSLVIGPAPGRGPTLMDDQGHPRDFMRASHVTLALRYGALYRQWKGTQGPLQVRLLDVDGIELNLKRDADGRANWQFGAARPATAASAPQWPVFERLNVRRGEVRYVDAPLQLEADAHVSTHEGTGRPGSAAAQALPGLQVNRGPASGASLSAASAVAAASGVVARVAAAASAIGLPASAPAEPVDEGPPGLRIEATGSYRQAQLVLRVRSSGLMPIVSNEADSPAVPVWLDVRAGRSHVRLDGTATDLFHFGGMDASFVASGPSLAAVGDAIGVTLPTTAAFETRGRLRKDGSVWNAAVASLRIGSSRLRGDFRFDAGPTVPLLAGTLGGRRLALADLGPAFGAAPSGPSASAPARADDPPGRVIPDREFDLPSLKAMNANVAVALDTLDLGTDKLEPFSPLRGRITLRDGVLRLDDLLARTSAGQLTGAIGLDSRPARPRWDAELAWSGIQLARFVKTPDTFAKKDANGRRPDTGYVSGRLGGDARLTGAGKSSAALLASLDGDVRLWVQDGQVSHLLVEGAGIDIADALGLVFKGDEKVPVQCAVAKLDVAKGQVLPEVAIVDTHASTLLVGGEVSLRDETLDLKLSARPHQFSPLAPHSFSPLAPRTPVDVDGTFAHPHVHLDAKPLLVRGAAAVALGLVNPLASLLALIDLRKPEREVCTAALKHLAEPERPGAAARPASSPRPARPPARGRAVPKAPAARP